MSTHESRPQTDDAALEGFFAAARDRAAPAPSDALMARILADADRLQPAVAAPALAVPPARPGLWRRLRRILPDLAPAGGLGLAALAGGLWIGLAEPDLAITLIPGALLDTTELFPGDADVVASFTLFAES